jgi:hypothetical protein
MGYAEPRRFTKFDWYGIAGCERFADGSEPWIVDSVKVSGWPDTAPEWDRDLDPEMVTIVADAVGFFVNGLEASLILDNAAGPDAKRAALVMLATAPSVAGLRALGFQPCTGTWPVVEISDNG